MEAKSVNDRSYTKLFSGIVTSTIWLEDSDTRVVWITLLALQDRYYEVHSSPGALARIAGVPPDKCNAALEKFMSPDPDSNNKAEGGRRVARVQGGWKIINGEFYRHLMSADERKEYKREKEHERREKIKNRGQCVDNRGQTVDTRGQILADKDKDVEEDKDIKKEPPIVPKGDDLPKSPKSHVASKEEIESLYQAYPKKVGKTQALKAIAKAMAAIYKRDFNNTHAWMLSRVQKYAEWRAFVNDSQFTRHPATWFNDTNYDDDDSVWTVKTNGLPKTAYRDPDEFVSRPLTDSDLAFIRNSQLRHIRAQAIVDEMGITYMEAKRIATREMPDPE